MSVLPIEAHCTHLAPLRAESRRRMTVVRGGADQRTELVMTEQDMYMTPLLPGLALPLAQLLAVADTLAAAEHT